MCRDPRGWLTTFKMLLLVSPEICAQHACNDIEVRHQVGVSSSVGSVSRSRHGPILQGQDGRAEAAGMLHFRLQELACTAVPSNPEPYTFLCR